MSVLKIRNQGQLEHDRLATVLICFFFIDPFLRREGDQDSLA